MPALHERLAPTGRRLDVFGARRVVCIKRLLRRTIRLPWTCGVQRGRPPPEPDSLAKRVRPAAGSSAPNTSSLRLSSAFKQAHEEAENVAVLPFQEPPQGLNLQSTLRSSHLCGVIQCFPGSIFPLKAACQPPAPAAPQPRVQNRRCR